VRLPSARLITQTPDQPLRRLHNCQGFAPPPLLAWPCYFTLDLNPCFVCFGIVLETLICNGAQAPNSTCTQHTHVEFEPRAVLFFPSPLLTTPKQPHPSIPLLAVLILTYPPSSLLTLINTQSFGTNNIDATVFGCAAHAGWRLCC